MLAERPKYPQEPLKLVTAKIAERYVVYFLPDNLKFGRWTNRLEAEEALKVWEENFTCQPAQPWRSYCRSRGWQSVSWV